MATIKERLLKAMKQEDGIRLSPADVVKISNMLRLNPEPGIDCNSEKPSAQLKPASRPPVACHIRWMIRRDIPQVLEIDSETPGGLWTEDDFIRCLRKRNCIGMVAEASDEIVAFMVYELHKKRLVLIRMAVAESQRMQSFGRQMIGKLQGKLSAERRSHINALVGLGNTPFLVFLRSVGFKAKGMMFDEVMMTFQHPGTRPEDWSHSPSSDNDKDHDENDGDGFVEAT